MAKAIARQDQVRPGEGALVDLSLLPDASVAGKGTATFQVSLASVPVPHKRYAADLSFVELVDETVHIFFGQRRLRSDELRSLVVIKMDIAWVHRFIRSIDDSSHPFEKYASDNKIRTEVLTECGEEPKDTVSFDANFTLAAIAGRQACLDFFYSSPFAFSASMGAKKLAIEPVLRVDLRASLLMGILAEMRKIVANTRSIEALEGLDHE